MASLSSPIPHAQTGHSEPSGSVTSGRNIPAPPSESLQVDQHFVNLFEVPILFYVACLSSLYISESLDKVTFVFAWIYFLGRVVHARICLTNNRLLWRARVYVFSGLILYSMWIWIVYIVIKSTMGT